MELFDVIRKINSRKGNEVSNLDKKRHSFMLSRLYAAGFPLQVSVLNNINIDAVTATNMIILLSKRYLNVPSFLKLKVSQKKKQDSIYKLYNTDEINKFCELEECGIREFKELVSIDKELVDNRMTEIREQYFNDYKIKKEKI